MPLPRPLHVVWSVHARLRELERIDDGVRIPDAGSAIRLMYLGVKDSEEIWLYSLQRSYLYGLIFKVQEYDVFLVKTILGHKRLWKEYMAGSYLGSAGKENTWWLRVMN